MSETDPDRVRGGRCWAYEREAAEHDDRHSASAPFMTSAPMMYLAGRRRCLYRCDRCGCAFTEDPLPT